jgi:probable rRNA maturation factor
MPSLSKSKVYFFIQHPWKGFKNRKILKSFVEDIFKNEKRGLDQMNYIFCSDKQLLVINKKYLNRNYYTDIITFDLSENKKTVRADAYISLDRVRENAHNLGAPIHTELHRIIFHGALHLCGYNDKKNNEAILMRKKEAFYLNQFSKKLKEV